MGNCSLGVSSNVIPIREYVVLLLGLDDSGKTTLLANLSREPTEDTTPTIGFSSTKLIIHRHHVTFYDLGGNSKVREIWKKYYSEAYGAVFMVDASASDRMSEAKEVLHVVLEDSKMKGKPVVVFANKQDQTGALSSDLLRQQLGLEETTAVDSVNPHIVACIALRRANRGKADVAIRQGTHWLLNQMKSQYVSLYERVTVDVGNQRQEEAQKRRERAERVRKMKEERERAKKLAGVTDKENENDNVSDTVESNPFKPISQVIVETEAREKAIKAQNEEIARRLKNVEEMKDQTEVDNSPSDRVSTAGRVSAGPGNKDGSKESESNENLEVTKSRADVRPAATCSESVDGAFEIRVVEAEIHSGSVTSGLSSSTDSLTDVTPGSTESPDGSSANLHSTIQICADVSAKMKRGDSRKSSKRSTLLSRMKNRNKTAPMPPQASGLSITNLPLEPPKAPAVLGPLRVSPSMTPTTSPTASRHSLSPLPLKNGLVASSSAVCGDTPVPSAPSPAATSQAPSAPSPAAITQALDIPGLPDLPVPRQSLPPIQALGDEFKFSGTTLLTEEDLRSIPLSAVTKLSVPPRPSPVDTTA